jgi:hypothetical protein
MLAPQDIIPVSKVRRAPAKLNSILSDIADFQMARRLRRRNRDIDDHPSSGRCYGRNNHRRRSNDHRAGSRHIHSHLGDLTVCNPSIRGIHSNLVVVDSPPHHSPIDIVRGVI